nr:hypothetical protein [Tanacetum cinerariifolium]
FDQSCLYEIHCLKDTWLEFHTMILELDANHRELSPPCRPYLDSQELTIFLGLQVKQKSDGIFNSHDKYVDEILRNFKSMIRSLMYLTSSRPDIKRIFRYLKGHPKLGLWYPKDSSFDLVAYTDSDYAGASLDRKSISGGCISTIGLKLLVIINTAKKKNNLDYVFLGFRLSFAGEFWRTASVRTLNNGEIELNATVDGQVKTIIEASVRRHLKLANANSITSLPTPEIFEQLALIGKTRTRTGRMGIRIPQSNVSLNAVDETITKEMHDGLERATTTATSLAASPERLSNLPNEPALREEKVTSLENELTSTKAIYNKALITLTKRVKKLVKQLKHKGRRAVINSSDDAKPSLDAKDSPKQ